MIKGLSLDFSARQCLSEEVLGGVKSSLNEEPHKNQGATLTVAPVLYHVEYIGACESGKSVHFGSDFHPTVQRAGAAFLDV